MTLPTPVLEAARTLDLRPRSARWRSVTYCVVDAVWSIGSGYDAVVAPLVRRVARECGDDEPLTPALQALGPDPLPLPRFRDRFPDVEALLSVTNKQRTSSRSGILKADAVLRYADTLLEQRVATLQDATACLQDLQRTEAVTRELRRIPGDGVRTGYFWMLVGDEYQVKPDRQVLKWFKNNGHPVDVTTARASIVEIADLLTQEMARPVTPWEVDNAIWRSMSRSRASY